MKKRLCILLLGLALCSMFICVAAASDITKRTSVNANNNYTLPVTGSKGIFTAEGGNKYCFSTLRNTFSTAIYATVSVQGYDMGNDTYTVTKTNTSTYLTKDTVLATSGLVREKGKAGNNMEYIHRGKTCSYINPNSVYDDFYYLIEQYYNE